MDWGNFRPSKATSVCLTLLGFAFLLMTFRLTGAVKNFRTFLLYSVSPVQEGSLSALEYASELGSKLIRLANAHRENNQLKDRILHASVLETQYREAMEENTRLRRLLELKSILPFKTIPALVTGRDPQSWTQTVWINRGESDHIAPNDPVVAVVAKEDGDAAVVQGLVGRVYECGNHSGKVLLVSDPLSAVVVSVTRTGEQGLVQGQGPYLTVEYLDLASQVQAGDEVVTSGLGGIFPAGIPVGTITQVESSPTGFKRGVVKPAASLGRLRDILILKLEKIPGESQ